MDEKIEQGAKKLFEAWANYDEMRQHVEFLYTTEYQEIWERDMAKMKCTLDYLDSFEGADTEILILRAQLVKKMGIEKFAVWLAAALQGHGDGWSWRELAGKMREELEG